MSEQRLTSYRHDAMTFDVIDTGPLDGPPVVLLHGFPQRASCWSQVSERLHERGARTYAPDMRGYSPGARPHSRFAYDGGTLATDVKALIDEIGTPVHVVGHDWGSAVAWAAAGRYPDDILTLTAVSVGHPAAFIKSMTRSSQALKSYYMALFQIPVLPERILSRPGGFGERMLRGSGMSREMYQSFLRDVVHYGALRGGLGYYRSLPKTPPKDTVRKVRIPTTYVWSDHDVALGRTAAELTADYVSGPYEFVEIHGASHWLPEQRPDEVATAIIERAGL